MSFQDAADALESDQSQQVEPDLDHIDEARLRVLAWSPKGRILFIVIVERDEHTMRIITARKATASEQNDYADRQS